MECKGKGGSGTIVGLATRATAKGRGRAVDPLPEEDESGKQMQNSVEKTQFEREIETKMQGGNSTLLGRVGYLCEASSMLFYRTVTVAPMEVTVGERWSHTTGCGGRPRSRNWWPLGGG